MSRDEYYTLCNTDDMNGAFFNKVDGKPVDIGIEGDFFIHHPTFYSWDNPSQCKRKRWVITEGQTGKAVFNKSARTQKEAIQIAIKTLTENKERFKLEILKSIKQYGKSPRYASSS